MSILDNLTSNSNPPKMIANNIINQTRNTYLQMVRAYNEGTKIFWQNQNGITPTEIATELGNNAKEVFQLHYALGQLLNSIKPEAIASSLEMIGQFTMNDDGTVTINPPVNEPVPPSPE